MRAFYSEVVDMSTYMPRLDRHSRQKIERDIWCEEAVDYLLDLGVYSNEQDEDIVQKHAKRLLLNRNIDEGGELVEPSAVKFIKELIIVLLKEEFGIGTGRE